MGGTRDGPEVEGGTVDGLGTVGGGGNAVLRSLSFYDREVRMRVMIRSIYAVPLSKNQTQIWDTRMGMRGMSVESVCRESRHCQ